MGFTGILQFEKPYFRSRAYASFPTTSQDPDQVIQFGLSVFSASRQYTELQAGLEVLQMG